MASLITLKVNKLITKLNIKTPPVDLEKIANHLKVKIEYEDLDDDVSGFLAVENGKAVAVINENHHANRQRFTLAHELGHFCLHLNKDDNNMLFIDKSYPIHNRDKDSSLGIYKKEREANLFASLLLMPRKMVEQEINDHEYDFFNDADTFQLARKFGVSEQAIGFRLAKLDYQVGDE